MQETAQNRSIAENNAGKPRQRAPKRVLRGLSCIQDGHAWTMDDEATLADLPAEKQAEILDWIRTGINPVKRRSGDVTSEIIKGYCERDIKWRITNNQFKDAMLMCGFRPVNEHRLNWEYCISKRSPALQKHKSGPGQEKRSDT